MVGSVRGTCLRCPQSCSALPSTPSPRVPAVEAPQCSPHLCVLAVPGAGAWLQVPLLSPCSGPSTAVAVPRRGLPFPGDGAAGGEQSLRVPGAVLASSSSREGPQEPRMALRGEQGSVPVPSIFKHLWETSAGPSCPQHPPGQGDAPSSAPSGGTVGLAQGDSCSALGEPWGHPCPSPLCGQVLGLRLCPREGQPQGLCQACAPCPGHLSWGWGAHQAACDNPAGVPWAWEGPGLGQCSRAGVFHEFHGLAHALL